jgi:hypothetical protein
VPLPLGLACIELPVVGDVPGVAELAAGSPVVEPRPLGAPLWAYAEGTQERHRPCNCDCRESHGHSFRIGHDNPPGKAGFRRHFLGAHYRAAKAQLFRTQPAMVDLHRMQQEVTLFWREHVGTSPLDSLRRAWTLLLRLVVPDLWFSKRS